MKRDLIFLFFLFFPLFIHSNTPESVNQPSLQDIQIENETEIVDVEILPNENEETSENRRVSTQEELEKQLIIEISELEERLQLQETTYQTYRGLAITGYALTGAGLGLVILDTLVATPGENPNSAEKFGNMTWGAIPFALLGTIFAITFRLLEEDSGETKLLTEGNLYDIKSELDLIQLQLYGTIQEEDELQ